MERLVMNYVLYKFISTLGPVQMLHFIYAKSNANGQEK